MLPSVPAILVCGLCERQSETASVADAAAQTLRHLGHIFILRCGSLRAMTYSYHPLTILAALIGLVLIAISILLCYGFADRLAQILGATGMTVITQLSSFFLVCIGVQIAWNGIKALLESLTLHFG